MYKHSWNILYGIFYIGVIDFALSQHKGLEKSVNLALETVFEFDKDGKSDIQLLNNVQKFIGKVKNVLERKHIERRQGGTDERNIFTNFILNIVNVLNKFEDDDLEKFFGIINNEIQRYCDKNDDIHILNKFGLVRNMPADILRRYLKTITNKIQEEAYFDDEKAIINGINYLFKQDDATKFDKFIHNLEEYRRKSRRNIDLVQVIKSALENIFLDTYYHFKPTAKTVLRTILHHYFGSFISLPTKYPVLKPSDRVNRAKSRTTRDSRTWRQMYVEKNLDLKYPTDYIPVTNKHKRKDKTRTQKSRVMTVPTTRATKESRQRKGKKYSEVIEYDINIDSSKHTDNSDEQSNSNDETTMVKTTKMFDEYYYKRDFNKKYDKQSNQYKTLNQYDEDEEKYKAEHKNLNKQSTFYLDLEKLSATSYAQQSFDTSTHEYKRPVIKPIGFTTGIKHGKYWDSRQKVKKSKHYGYIQKKRKDVFSNEQQIPMTKKDPEMARMPPVSLNRQLSVTKELSTVGNGVGDTKNGVKYISRYEDVRNPLSEEGLSIEGFQETQRRMYNRRSDNHSDTANNHVLNLIKKLEQDLEAVKTKIRNVSVFKNENNLDDISKVTEIDVNKFKTTIKTDKNVSQEVSTVRKFYEERNRYGVENKKKNYSSLDEKVTFNSTGVNEAEPIYMAARKTINDQKWYPVVRARESDSTEIIIQRKYEPLEKALLKQNDNDSKVNLKVINNNISFGKDYSTKNEENNSSTTMNYLKEKTKHENRQNTTIIKVSANTNENDIYLNIDSKENTLQPNLEDKALDHKGTAKDVTNDDKTLPNYYKNVKLTGDDLTNNRNTNQNATKHNIAVAPNKIKDRPKFRSQLDEINNVENETLKEKEIPTTKNGIKTTLVVNYKNTTDSAVTVSTFITTRKVTKVALNENKLKKTVVDEIDRQHVAISNNNITMIPKLNKLKEISPTDSTTVDALKKSLPDKTS